MENGAIRRQEQIKECHISRNSTSNRRTMVMRRKYVPKELFVVWIGPEPFACRFLSTFLKTQKYSDHTIKTIYRFLKTRKFWAKKDGTVIIRKVPWLDYLPKKGAKAYEDSLPEYRWEPKLKNNGNSSK
jgi:hypothetical protein